MMQLRPRLFFSTLVFSTLALLAVLLGLPAGAAAKETANDTGDEKCPEIAGMVFFAGAEKQPIGMTVKELKAFIDKDLDGAPRDMGEAKWEGVWDHGFLLMTPRHEQELAAFLLGKFEVTNAQWKVFHDSARMHFNWKVEPGLRTLEGLVKELYGIDPDLDMGGFQRAWRYVLARNESVLMEHLNPDGADDWDPLVARAHLSDLPVGAELSLTWVLPPFDPRSWNTDGTIKDGARNRPVHGVAWFEALRFCRWAGFHLPRAAEWEHGARGQDGRRFAWGDKWNTAAAVWRGAGDSAEDVDTRTEFATPEGLHHMTGNVNEWQFDRVRTYGGSKTTFDFSNNCFAARGGHFASKSFELLAADRHWDAGRALTSTAKVEGFGFRLAAYEQAGKDLTMEVGELINDTDAMRGPWLWIPRAFGLTEATPNPRIRALHGVSADRTGGWVARNLSDGGGNHVYVQGPARGIACMPVKGLLSSKIKSVANFLSACAKDEGVFLGVLVATENCSMKLFDVTGTPRRKQIGGEEGEEVWEELPPLDFKDGRLWTEDERMGFERPVGALLVARGDRVAVYPADPAGEGIYGKHLQLEPLGYLPTPLVAEWGQVRDLRSSGDLERGRATLSVVIPQMDTKGRLLNAGLRLTVEAEVTFTNE